MSASIDGSALRLTGDELDRTVERDALTFVAAHGGGPARIVFSNGGLCEIDDRAGAASLFATLGHRAAASERLVARGWQVVAVTLAFVAAMASLWTWGIPFAADRLVDRAPRSWDEALGGRLLRTLEGQGVFRPSTLPQATQDRIRQRFAVLAPSSSLPSGLRLELLFRRLGVPNALALPGGTIVLTDELVELADDDDAVATVLSHEVGHQVHRDALRQLARSSIGSALAFWYFGDVSNAAAVAAGSLGTLRYTRAAEHRADLYALATMRANGIPTRGAAALFRRLEAWSPRPVANGAQTSDGEASRPSAGERRRPRFPEYLSTHPDTADRIRLFEDGGPAPSAS